MKNPIIIIIILISCFSCKSVKYRGLISNHKVEGISAGMPISKAIDNLSTKFFIDTVFFPKSEDFEEKATEYHIYKDKTKKVHLFSINALDNKNDKIFRIKIFSPAYKTSKGISVNKTFGELKKKYKIGLVAFNYDDGLGAEVIDLDGAVLLDIKSSKTKFDFENPKVDKLPNDLKIQLIVLF